LMGRMLRGHSRSTFDALVLISGLREFCVFVAVVAEVCVDMLIISELPLMSGYTCYRIPECRTVGTVKVCRSTWSSSLALIMVYESNVTKGLINEPPRRVSHTALVSLREWGEFGHWEESSVRPRMLCLRMLTVWRSVNIVCTIPTTHHPTWVGRGVRRLPFFRPPALPSAAINPGHRSGSLLTDSRQTHFSSFPTTSRDNVDVGDATHVDQRCCRLGGKVLWNVWALGISALVYGGSGEVWITSYTAAADTLPTEEIPSAADCPLPCKGKCLLVTPPMLGPHACEHLRGRLGWDWLPCVSSVQGHCLSRVPIPRLWRWIATVRPPVPSCCLWVTPWGSMAGEAIVLWVWVPIAGGQVGMDCAAFPMWTVAELTITPTVHPTRSQTI